MEAGGHDCVLVMMGGGGWNRRKNMVGEKLLPNGLKQLITVLNATKGEVSVSHGVNVIPADSVKINE